MINNFYEYTYKNLIKDILVNGNEEPVRDNNTAKVLFGKSLEFDNNSDLFPMLTSKRMFFKNIKYELRWIISGSSDLNYLNENGVHIWDDWADGNNTIGETYGVQLRCFDNVDQLENILKELNTFKYSRQLVVSLWNPKSIMHGNIKPCYHAFQYVFTGGKLNIIVSQRSSDVFVGLPYDICVFNLLLITTCNQFNMIPGIVKINIGNAHIYKEHYDACNVYLNNPTHPLPKLYHGKQGVFFDVREVKLIDYKSEDFIKVPIIK